MAWRTATSTTWAPTSTASTRSKPAMSTPCSGSYREPRERSAAPGVVDAQPQELADKLLHGLCTLGQELETRLVHVGFLHQLQLHRIDRVPGTAVVAGDVAALETPVRHMAENVLPLEAFSQAPLQAGMAARAAGSPQVEVGESAGKQHRHMTTDRMAVPEHGLPVGRQQAVKLKLDGLVVGSPIGLDALLDLRGIRLLAWRVQRLAIETHGRDQAGFLPPRIQRLAVRGPVQVDHVT